MSSTSNKGREALVPVAGPPQGLSVFTCLQGESRPQTPSGPSGWWDSANPDAEVGRGGTAWRRSGWGAASGCADRRA